MNLKELLGEELYDQVKGKLGDKKLMIDDGNFIPKSRFDEVNNQKKELKEEVDTLNKTLKTNAKDFEKLQKSAQGNEELQKQLQEYQNKLNSTQTEFNNTLTAKEQEWQQREVNNRKSYAMREKLIMEHADPKYIDLLMKEINLDSITENDGKFIGVDDVVSSVKSNFDKLFGKPQVVGTGVANGLTVNNNNAGVDLDKLAEKARSGRKEDRLAYMKAKQEIENIEE